MWSLIPPYLLWRNFKSLSPHIHFLVNVHTGNDEEDSWPSGSSSQQTAQSEDDGPLVLLDHLHHEEEGDGERCNDDDERDDGHEGGADSSPFLTH